MDYYCHYYDKIKITRGINNTLAIWSCVYFMYLDILQMKRVHPMSHINYSDQNNHANGQAHHIHKNKWNHIHKNKIKEKWNSYFFDLFVFFFGRRDLLKKRMKHRKKKPNKQRRFPKQLTFYLPFPVLTLNWDKP